MSAFLGPFAPAHLAAAAQPGCVDLLTDCSADSPLLESVCGSGSHTLSPPVSNNISYVVFGPGVQRVTLTECEIGAQSVITGSTDLCSLDDTNDNTCAIDIAIGSSSAPSMSSAGLGILTFALLILGIRLQRRSTGAL